LPDQSQQMIYAEQRWLETGTRQRVLHISERELNLYCQNANKCATLLMILAGYCYDAYATGYMYDDLDGDLCGHRERACGEILYPLTNMFTTFLSLSTMWSCMLLTMLAPGKALHGSPDEFAYILRVVESEFQWIGFYVGISVVSFFVTIVVWSWSDKEFGIETTALLTLQMCASAFVIYWVAAFLFHKFQVPIDKVVRTWQFGKFWARPNRTKYQYLHESYGDEEAAKALADDELSESSFHRSMAKVFGVFRSHSVNSHHFHLPHLPHLSHLSHHHSHHSHLSHHSHRAHDSEPGLEVRAARPTVDEPETADADAAPAAKPLTPDTAHVRGATASAHPAAHSSCHGDTCRKANTDGSSVNNIDGDSSGVSTSETRSAAVNVRTNSDNSSGHDAARAQEQKHGRSPVASGEPAARPLLSPRRWLRSPRAKQSAPPSPGDAAGARVQL